MQPFKKLCIMQPFKKLIKSTPSLYIFFRPEPTHKIYFIRNYWYTVNPKIYITLETKTASRNRDNETAFISIQQRNFQTKNSNLSRAMVIPYPKEGLMSREDECRGGIATGPPGKMVPSLTPQLAELSTFISKYYALPETFKINRLFCFSGVYRALSFRLFPSHMTTF